MVGRRLSIRTCGMLSLHTNLPDDWLRLWPAYQATPLLDRPRLAARGGVARVWVKDESARPLGSFKSLGGVYAGLRALARAAGASGLGELLEARPARRELPALLCASDGNHGLAVAAGAQRAGAAARVYLHAGVPPARAARIARLGAELVRVPGTYDDAVAEAARAAARGEGLLIADTSSDEDDPVVADVMAGYGVMARELAAQLPAPADERPTHLFVQAGVGGLAAALATGLEAILSAPACIVVVEPANAACVAAALEARSVRRVAGSLETEAEMLSCGEVSAPALRVLLRHGARAVVVGEAALGDAVKVLAECGGPPTTPSGAAGLAGLLACFPGSAPAAALGIDAASRVLLIATEGPVPENEP